MAAAADTLTFATVKAALPPILRLVFDADWAAINAAVTSEAAVKAGFDLGKLRGPKGLPPTVLLVMGFAHAGSTTPSRHPGAAAAQSFVLTLNVIVRAGCGIDEVDSAGFTALMYAVGRYPAPELAHRLVELGANIHTASPAGVTALHLAAIAGIPAMVKLLLDHEADVFATAADGNRPVEVTSNDDCLKLLVEFEQRKEAELTARIRRLHEATVDAGEIDKPDSVATGSDADSKDADSTGDNEEDDIEVCSVSDMVQWFYLRIRRLGSLPSFVEQICAGNLAKLTVAVQHGLSINEADPIVHYALLHWACLFNQLDIVRFLLAAPTGAADVCQQGIRGTTPLMLAVTLGRVGIAQVLLQHGHAVQQLNTLDVAGMTPLHEAALIGDTAVPMVKLLLQHGANCGAVDELHRTPEQCANSAAVKQLLQQHVAGGRATAPVAPAVVRVTDSPELEDRPSALPPAPAPAVRPQPAPLVDESKVDARQIAFVDMPPLEPATIPDDMRPPRAFPVRIELAPYPNASLPLAVKDRDGVFSLSVPHTHPSYPMIRDGVERHAQNAGRVAYFMAKLQQEGAQLRIDVTLGFKMDW